MPISLISTDTSRPITVTQHEQVKLCKSESKDKLSSAFSSIKNTTNELEINKSIAVKMKEIYDLKIVMCQIQTVATKHGENATLRIKDGHIKYGEGSNFLKNMLHSSSYQTEREDLAHLFLNAKEGSVTAGMAIKPFQHLHDKTIREVEELLNKQLPTVLLDPNNPTPDNPGRKLTIIKYDNFEKQVFENFSGGNKLLKQFNHLFN